MASTPTTPSDTLHLSLRLATHPNAPFPTTSHLQLAPDSTVLQLKQQLEKDWDGRPRKEGVTVVKGGRVLRDGEELRAVFEDELKAEVRCFPFLS
jgi:hypothetical protein